MEGSALWLGKALASLAPPGSIQGDKAVGRTMTLMAVGAMVATASLAGCSRQPSTTTSGGLGLARANYCTPVPISGGSHQHGCAYADQ